MVSRRAQRHAQTEDTSRIEWSEGYADNTQRKKFYVNTMQSRLTAFQYIVQTPAMDSTPWAIGGRELNISTEVLMRTLQLHQPHLLWGPSSQQDACYQAPSVGNGRLFSGKASGLDAFSPYPQWRGCPAVPCRTTGKLEATASRSSRTGDPFPSGDQHSQQIKSDLSHDGLNPAHVPF